MPLDRLCEECACAGARIARVCTSKTRLARVRTFALALRGRVRVSTLLWATESTRESART
eukprot:6178336-Pleurochrysis_carterae.AAC.2